MSTEDRSSFLSELRAATGESHARLDGKLGLLEGAMNERRYADFLRGSLSALEPLEASLSPWAELCPSRCSLIRGDLSTLGYPARGAAIPLRVSISSPAQAFGARYVIEGSALGGAVLARAFQKALSLNADSLSFLTLHGDGLADHWRAFTRELEAWGKTASTALRSEACGSARAVFDVYEEAFQAVGAFSPPS